VKTWIASVLFFLSSMTIAAETGVLRFWWNRDNPTDGQVNGIADRENFFPMLLDIRPFVDAWSSGGASFRLRGNGAVNVVWTSMSRSDVWALYRNGDVLTGEGFSTPLDSASVTQITPSGENIPEGVLRRIRSGDDVVLACEVRPGAHMGIIQFEVVAGGNTHYRFPMGCYASDVTNMYHWINLRHVSGQEEEVPTMAGPPGNADWSEDLPHVFFVHGANVGEEQSRVWCEKIFKRLYLSGAKMRFHGVSWRSQMNHTYDYHLNASNAFDVAASLANVVNSFHGRKLVLAHSLGTMVVSSAIQDHGMQVDKFFLFNSAVPSEAFDGELADYDSSNHLVHDDWMAYTNMCWSARWNELFPVGDARRMLTWRGRFASVAPVAVNFFSSGDEVLEIYSLAHNPSYYNGVSPSGNWGDRYAWHKQELWKGRASLLGFMGTTEWSGWGFSTHFEQNEFTGQYQTIRDFSPGQASALCQNPEVMRTNTVFRLYPASLTNVVNTRLQSDYHLTQGIPSLSPATGRMRFDDLVMTSYDMNDAEMRGNGWPRESDGGELSARWLHSDMKNIEYYYTFPLYDLICTEGGLK